MNYLYIMLMALLMVFLSGCLPANYSVKEQQQRDQNRQNMIACPVDRPMSCGKEKDLVCGVFEDGSTWQYSSGCMACTRHVVTGYLPGPCGKK